MTAVARVIFQCETPECGDGRRFSPNVTLEVWAGSDGSPSGWAARVVCPNCGETQRFHASERQAESLTEQHVDVEHFPYCEQDTRPRPFAKPVTHDDALEFHEQWHGEGLSDEQWAELERGS